jgi:hypothetical protein
MVLLVPTPGIASRGVYWRWKRLLPGSRKSSGETLFEALMPLQPAPRGKAAAPIANRRIFQFNLTE